jgi:hypothetical protein
MGLGVGDWQGALIAVHPVLFSQGVNEQQTVANAMGDAGLQDRLNWESLMLLRAYVGRYRAWLAAPASGAGAGLPPPAVALRADPAEAAVNSLAACIVGARGAKNIDVLTLGETAARLCVARGASRFPSHDSWRGWGGAREGDTCRLGGGRITSCKSAKDRSSMAVTAELAGLAQANHLVRAHRADRGVST